MTLLLLNVLCNSSTSTRASIFIPAGSRQLAPGNGFGQGESPNAVILQDDEIDTSLDPTDQIPSDYGELLKAPPKDFLDCYPVSRQVNSVKFDEPEYAERIDLDYGPLLQSES